MFKSVLLYKVLTVVGCMLLMFIPIQQLINIVHEREEYQEQVIDQVADSTSREQRVLGPVIVIPYTLTTTEINKKERHSITREYFSYELPQQLNIDGKPQVEIRKVGLYQTQLYHSDLHFSANFKKVDTRQLVSGDNVKLSVGKPYLVVMLSDARGIRQISSLKANATEIAFEPGVQGDQQGQGMHADIPLELLTGEALKIDFTFKISGSSSLEVVPLGRTTEMTLRSNWPHPSFLGRFLPDTHSITDKGFSASWHSSWYANNLNHEYQVAGEQIPFNNIPAFRVGLVEPVDHYQLTERSIKYAILFIGLTFGAFFMFEMLTMLRLHPMQYILVGAALSMFYLVLLAFAERIGFTLAYLIASLSCSALIGFYLSAVLQGWIRGVLFSIGLLVLYGVLYMLLHSEDNSLMLGSVLLFSILALIMSLTRRFDWHRVTSSSPSPQKQSQESETPPSDEDGAQEENVSRKSFRLWK